MTSVQPLPHPDSYTYRTEWSVDDHEFRATVAEFPSLSWLAKTPEHAEAGLKAVVHETLLDLQHSGGTVPQPLPRPVPWPPGPLNPPPSYYPTFQMPAATNQGGVQQVTNVNVGVGGGYHRRGRRALHIWMTVLSCGMWAPIWIADEVLTGSGTR